MTARSDEPRGGCEGPDPRGTSGGPVGRLLLWSRVWSPLVPVAWREAAWRELGLPRTWPELEPDYWSVFQVGLPAPQAPLLLHAALGTAGANAREDWLRVIDHLGLEWTERRLAPDHLGAACEVVACALARGEALLARELVERYLEPWCRAAVERIEPDRPVADLPRRFARDLRVLG